MNHSILVRHVIDPDMPNGLAWTFDCRGCHNYGPEPRFATLAHAEDAGLAHARELAA